MSYQLLHGDCLEVMRGMPTGHVSLCFTSPPYEDARTYGVGFKLKGQGWVDWMAPRVVEMCRVTAGLVFVNAAGKVSKFRYSPVMEWLVADLTRVHGLVCGPAPYVFHRVGIPGSGGPHYHRRDWEPGSIVFDPFCGSGTVLKVAVANNRRGIGIDVRDGKGGLDTARRRLELVTPLALLTEDRPS
jgi:hypothetical protein